MIKIATIVHDRRDGTQPQPYAPMTDADADGASRLRRPHAAGWRTANNAASIKGHGPWPALSRPPCIEALGGTAAKYSNDRTVQHVRLHSNAAGPAQTRLQTATARSSGRRRRRFKSVTPTSRCLIRDTLEGHLLAASTALECRCSTTAALGQNFVVSQLGWTALRFARDYVRTDRQWLAGADVPQGGA